MPDRYVVGVDVGGTFTDLVAISSDGTVTYTKSPSTPEDQSEGVLAGIADLARRVGLSASGLLSATKRFVHGTTVATNALLERKGARVVLLTTAGHRDVLEMREGLKPDRYNLRMPPSEALVHRDRRLGIRERIDASGAVRIPLDEQSVALAIDRIKGSDVTSVAVCYLHAYRNPEHEIRTVDLIRSSLPDIYVCRSSQVLPKIKEYERLSTTVVNAYVGPAVETYLRRLKLRLSDSGFAGGLFIILSHGGMVTIEQAGRLAAATVLSGPAGGVAGAIRCASALGLRDVVPFDMGGTSTDVSVITDGAAALTSAGGLAGQRIALRSLDIASVGAGGGSIAKVDSGGTLLVGPESAGSRPGPACYGYGGTAATVTDANVVLGYLDPGRFLVGGRPIDREAAYRAVSRVADRLGLSPDLAAAGIFRLINQKMADGVRIVTLRRGVDPRRFSLLSFGGAAGLHVVEVARQLEIGRIVVPNVASVLSAWGMLQSDLRYEVARTYAGPSGKPDRSSILALYEDLERRVSEEVREWFAGPVRFERWAELRYGEQIFEIDVALDGVDWGSHDVVDQIGSAFHRRHEQLYTYASPEQNVVFANARVAAISPPTARHEIAAKPGRSAPGEPASREAFFDGWRQTPVHQLADLPPRTRLDGPAIIEAETTTVVIGRGDVATVDERGWVDIRVGLPAGA